MDMTSTLPTRNFSKAAREWTNAKIAEKASELGVGVQAVRENMGQAQITEMFHRALGALETLWMPELDLRLFDIIAVSTSGGKDSQAQLDYVATRAKAEGVLDRVVAIHADLGNVEWEGTSELAEEQAAHYGIPIMFTSRIGQVCAPQNASAMYDAGEQYGDIVDYALRKSAGFKKAGDTTSPAWPASKARWCTSEFKTGPIKRTYTILVNQWREAHPGVTRRVRILECLGFRTEESASRGKRPVFELDASKSTKTTRAVYTWLPIKPWSVEDVWTRIEQSGVRHHWAYDKGMPRLSCAFCIFAPKDALLIAGEHNRALLDKYVEAEDEIGHSFKADLSLREVRDELEARDEERRRSAPPSDAQPRSGDPVDMLASPRILSLFSGAGGMDLGFRAAMRNAEFVGMVELADYPRAILAKRFPGVPLYRDVRDVAEMAEKAELKPLPTIVTGGFPCTDVSTLGPGGGLAGKRSGLYYEMARIVAATKPDWVVYENVPALRRRGLNVLLGDLQRMGYEASWDGVPAANIGAPHIRDRIFVVAYRPGVDFRFRAPSPALVTPGVYGGGRWNGTTPPPINDPDTPRAVRSPQLMAAGNAVVPAVAEHLAELIVEAGRGLPPVGKEVGTLTPLFGWLSPDGVPLKTFPRAGVMRGGIAYEVPSSTPLKRNYLNAELAPGALVWVRNPDAGLDAVEPGQLPYEDAVVFDAISRGAVSELDEKQLAIVEELIEGNWVHRADDGLLTLTFFGKSILERTSPWSYRGEGGANDEFPGIVVFDNHDLVDVELPNGEIEPFPRDHLQLYPTPSASDWKGGFSDEGSRNELGIDTKFNKRKKGAQVRHWVDGAVNPRFSEFLMGFPAGWLEVDR